MSKAVTGVMGLAVLILVLGCEGAKTTGGKEGEIRTQKDPAAVSKQTDKKKDEVSQMKAKIPPHDISGELRIPNVPKTTEEVGEACDAGIAKAREFREQLVKVEGERTVDNTLGAMNQIYIAIDAILPFSELIANVHPEKDVRTAAENCQQDAMKFVSELGLDREVYDALASLKTDVMDDLAKRSLERHLRDYRRSGVDKDDATRKELAQIKDDMVKVGQEFSRRIREGKLSIAVAPADLDGLPEDFIKSHPAGKNGKVVLTTDYPDFFPVQNYVKSAKVRQDLYIQFLARAYPENEATLVKLLELRHKYATILGYPNWAQYNAEDKMAKDQKTIAEFIEKVSSIARPRMQADLTEVLARKKQDDPEATDVNVWDRFYYVKKIQEEKFGVDSQEVRKYFDYTKVRDGILAVNEELFGVKFVKVPDAPVWHESVVAYDLVKDGKPSGRFFLDMHPREGKYGHAAMFPVITGISETQLPVATLVCNFPQPGEDGLALMEHGDVTTFFHEFGHLVHHLLGGGYKWSNLSGIACEWDFVEAPSQILEEWAWDVGVLSRFAVHHETGATIPAELVKKMRAGEEFGKGMHVMRQMFYAALSFNYHNRSPQGIDLLALLKDIQGQYNPYPYAEGTFTFANFGHLEGYSSMYYTYMWSLNLAKDLYTRFEKEGMMNKETASAYANSVIGAGGAVDAVDMVKNFLGREPSIEAFEQYLQRQ